MRGTLVVAAIAVAVVGGCATASRSDIVTAKADVINKVEDARQQLSREHTHVGEGDLVALKRSIEEADEKTDETRRKLEDQVKAAQEAEARSREIARRVGETVGLLGPVVGLVNADIGRVAGDVGKVLADQGRFQERLTTHDVAISDNKRGVADAQKRADEAAQEAKALQARLGTLDQDLQQRLAAAAGGIKADLEGIRKETDPTKQRALLDDRLKELGLTADDIAKLQGEFSTEDLLKLLGVLAGAGGAGFAASKTGKSRAQGDLDTLKKQLAAKNLLS